MKAVKTVSATESKQRCLALLEEIRQTCQSMLVTCHGKPVAEISPCIPRERDSANALDSFHSISRTALMASRLRSTRPHEPASNSASGPSAL